MKLTDHDQTAVNNCADAIVYYESIVLPKEHERIAGDLIGNHGAFELREQCALLAMDFNEFIAAHFENYSEFKEYANRYFNRSEYGSRSQDKHWLNEWDWDLCPAIIGRVLKIWEKDGNTADHDLYSIRLYHAQVLTDISNHSLSRAVGANK